MSSSWWSNLFSGKKTKKPYSIVGKPKDPRQGDQMILSQLAKMGCDMTQPREVIHYLYLSSEESSCLAAEALRQQGYQAEQRPAANATSDSKYPWVVIAKTDDLANDKTVELMRQLFETLATKYGRDYDGWEAAARP